MNLFLVMSPGGGGSAEDFQRMKLYLVGTTKNTTPDIALAVKGLFYDKGEPMTRMHLAERDPQHHHWPSDGVKSYLADANPARHAEPQHGGRAVEPALRLRILLSYHYYKDTDLDALFARYFTPPYPEVFLDSGGFSAMSKGVTIDLDAYCAFIRRFNHLITTYANLDVIGDAAGTLSNQERMEAKGLAPLPVFHVGEDWRYLEQYIERAPYLALGGMVPYMRDARRKLLPWLIQCFKRAEGRAVFHGFGCTSWDMVKALPWYSVDSSSWGAGFRFGEVPLFDERAGRFIKVSLGNHVDCFARARLIRELGFAPADFADRARNDRAKICAISALSYLKAEQWLRRRHGPVVIPSRPGSGTPENENEDAGVKAHLATGGVLGGVEAPRGEYPRGLALAHDHARAGLHVHLVDSPHTPLRDTSAAARGIAEVETRDRNTAQDTSAGLRTYLSDTSNGINYRDADAGLKRHLVTGAGGDLAAAQEGLQMYLATSQAHGDLSDITKVQQGLQKQEQNHE